MRCEGAGRGRVRCEGAGRRRVRCEGAGRGVCCQTHIQERGVDVVTARFIIRAVKDNSAVVICCQGNKAVPVIIPLATHTAHSHGDMLMKRFFPELHGAREWWLVSSQSRLRD